MEALNLLPDNKQQVEWEYDGEADVLYIRFGPPRPAVGIDIGEGTVLCFDEKERKIVGITIIEVSQRVKNAMEQ